MRLTQHREESKRGERRILYVLVGLSLAAFVSIYLWAYGSAHLAYWRYQPRDGDILFQSLPHSRLVNAIEGVTQSPYSHCGIVIQRDGKWFVCEAYQRVEMTSLKDFIFRGRRQGFTAFRLRTAYRRHIPETLRRAQEYLGRPYDVRYRLDDEAIYCSELIFKAYQSVTGGELGQLERLRDLDWRPYQGTIRHFEGGPVPLDRKMITPVNLALAEQLELVFAHKLSVPVAGN